MVEKERWSKRWFYTRNDFPDSKAQVLCLTKWLVLLRNRWREVPDGSVECCCCGCHLDPPSEFGCTTEYVECCVSVEEEIEIHMVVEIEKGVSSNGG